MTGRWKRYQALIDRERDLWRRRRLLLLLLAHIVKSELTGIQGTACWKRNIRPAWDDMEIFYHFDQMAGRDSCLLENLSK
jgi:hypothetical protein